MPSSLVANLATFCEIQNQSVFQSYLCYRSLGAVRLVAARLILSVAIYHYQLYELFGAKKVADLNQADLSNAYANILYAGLKP